MSVEDTDLLRRYLTQRSDEAFAKLVRRHLDLVYQTAVRQLGGRTDGAADVAQSVFVLLARKATSLQRHPSLAGWLHTTSRYIASDLRRAEQRRRHREAEAFAMHDLSSSDSPGVDWNRLRPVIDDVLGEMKHADREAILLRFFAGLPLADVGARLSVSENTARMRIERALDRLRTRLIRRGMTSTATALATVLASSPAAGAPAGLAASITTTALASATAVGTTGVGVMGLLTFMNNAKIVVGLAAVLSVGGVGSALWQGAEAREARSVAAATSRQRDALQKRLDEAEQRLTEAEQREQRAAGQLVAAQHRLESTNAAALPVPPGRPPSTPNRGATAGKTSLDQLLVRNPAFQSAQLKLHRAGLRLTYGPLYRSLNLTGEQIAEFEDAMSDYMQSHMETMAVVAEQGLAAADPKLGALLKPLHDSLGRRLHGALGEQGMIQFGVYEQSKNARDAVTSLAGNLYYTEAPLTAIQANQLTKIVAAHTGVMETHGLTATPRAVNWDAVLLQARGVLAPSQLATLQALGEQAVYQQRINELANAVVGDADSATAASAPPTGDSPKG